MLKPIKQHYRRLKKSFFYRNTLAGIIVELMGNKGRISGLKFDLDNPYIATFLKSRFFFKTYEDGAEELVKKYIDPNLPVVEFGGCIGVISCLTNRQLNNKRNHIVVEAQPHLIPTLEKNKNTNQCEFTIINAALAYESDNVDFWINPSYFIGNRLGKKAGKGGELVSVPAITFKSIINEYGYDRVNLIVDIEGAELDLINKELSVIVQFVDTLIIELHNRDWGAGQDGVDRIKKELLEAGFTETHRVGRDYVYQNSKLKAHNSEILVGGSFCGG